jgi:catechol 2,3-dioxygenase-like lactoylglutathione lyase family enzyme
MIKLNHFTIPVADYSRSRDWYQRNLGLNVEFEIPERKTVALQDDNDLMLFLVGSGSEL